MRSLQTGRSKQLAAKVVTTNALAFQSPPDRSCGTAVTTAER